ncbi:MAG: glycosyltransferase family 2 protein [Planctomycetes bacterium]|nr:glycosyltransferase family 2 protein [Planctomycetota bacterium]
MHVPEDPFESDRPMFRADGDAQPGGPDLSVVLPFHNEAANLPELLARLHSALQPGGLAFELIFVDDGSTDDGAMIIEEAAGLDERIKLLVLSRNFGQHIAGTAGIDIAQGRMVLWMDTDLQERPEDIPRFVAKFREGFDVVYARRRSRRQSRFRALASRWALSAMNRLVGLDVSPDRACMRLFSADVAQAMRRCEERNRYVGYLMPWVGYRSAEIEIEIDSRCRGRTKYSMFRLMRHAVNGLTAFSVAPLRVAAMLSIMTIAGCVIGIGYVLYRYFMYGFVISGWASLMIAMLMLHSMQFVVLAVLGEYVGLTYTETKRRPLYLCARRINCDKKTTGIRSMATSDALGHRTAASESAEPASLPIHT